MLAIHAGQVYKEKFNVWLTTMMTIVSTLGGAEMSELDAPLVLFRQAGIGDNTGLILRLY